MKFKTIAFAGQKWEQHWVRPTHKVFQGETCHAIMVPEKCRVYFSSDSPEPVYEMTFVHENFGHVAFYVSGASQMILEKFDGDSEAADAWEELLVQKLELVWYPLLKQFNFQFPKPAPKQA
jgi:hypothetical protein